MLSLYRCVLCDGGASHEAPSVIFRSTTLGIRDGLQQQSLWLLLRQCDELINRVMCFELINHAGANGLLLDSSIGAHATLHEFRFELGLFAGATSKGYPNDRQYQEFVLHIFKRNLLSGIANEYEDSDDEDQDDKAAKCFTELRENHDWPQQATSEVVHEAAIAIRAKQPAVQSEEQPSDEIGVDYFLFDGHDDL